MDRFDRHGRSPPQLPGGPAVLAVSPRRPPRPRRRRSTPTCAADRGGEHPGSRCPAPPGPRARRRRRRGRRRARRRRHRRGPRRRSRRRRRVSALVGDPHRRRRGDGHPGRARQPCRRRSSPSRSTAPAPAGVFGGAGSGVVISDDGLVLTNAHVVSGAQTITVRFFDGETSSAELVGSFPDDDVALVRVEDTDGLVPATLGDSERPAGRRRGRRHRQRPRPHRPADRHPGHRLGPRPRDRRRRRSPSSDLIQTDAAINPGNSGGPARRRRRHRRRHQHRHHRRRPEHRLRHRHRRGQAADRGHPGRQRRDHARHRLPRRLHGRCRRRRPRRARPLRRRQRRRRRLRARGRARHAGRRRPGIEAGDLIVEHRRRRRCRPPEEVRDAVRGHEPGDEVEIEIERDGETQELTAELGSITGCSEPVAIARPYVSGRGARGQRAAPGARPHVLQGPVAPHWEVQSDFGDRAMIEEFRARALARLELLPPHDPQFRRNRERVARDAERENLLLEWDLGIPEGARRPHRSRPVHGGGHRRITCSGRVASGGP